MLGCRFCDYDSIFGNRNSGKVDVASISVRHEPLVENTIRVLRLKMPSFTHKMVPFFCQMVFQRGSPELQVLLRIIFYCAYLVPHTLRAYSPERPSVLCLSKPFGYFHLRFYIICFTKQAYFPLNGKSSFDICFIYVAQVLLEDLPPGLQP